MKKLFTLTFLSIFGLTFAQVPSYVPTNGLVGWWPFNGNANDESGNGNDGTVNGATLTSDRFNVPDKSYYFNSANCATRIDINNFNYNGTVSSFSISFWIKRVGNGCISPRLFEFGNGAGWGVNWINGNANMDWVSGLNIPNNTWFHLVYVIQPDTIKSYVNGSFNSQFTITNSIASWFGQQVCFGRMNHPAYDAFNGNLDDIGTWNRALTQSEITALYTNTPPPTFSILANGCPNVSCQPTNFTPNVGSTYQWTITPSAGAQNSTGLNTANPSFIFNSGGTYSVTVQETNNGNTLTSAPASISILDLTNLTPSVNGSVMQNINGINTFSNCSGPNTTSALVFNENWGMTNPTNTTYSYTINNGAQIPITTSATVPIIYGNNMFTLTATNGVCALTNTINIYSGANPYVSLGASNSINLCPGSTVNFVIDPTQSAGVNNSPGTTYSLIFSDNPTAPVNMSNLVNDTIIPHQYNVTSCGVSNVGTLFPNNTYYAVVTAQNACGTTQSSYNPITVHNLPTANFTVSDSTICAGQTITVTNTGITGSIAGTNAPYTCTSQGKFKWIITGGIFGTDFTIPAGQQLGYTNINQWANPNHNGSSVLNVTFITPGNYSITQDYYNSCGFKTFVRNIQVGGGIPFVSLGASNSINLCPGSTVNFVIDPTQSAGVNNSPGTTYSLIFSDNPTAPVNMSNLVNDTIIPHQYNVTSCGVSNSGTTFPNNTYYAVVTAQNPCGTTQSYYSPITVHNLPTAEFTVSDSTICTGQTVTVTNTGITGSIAGTNAPYTCTSQGKFKWIITGGILGTDFTIPSGQQLGITNITQWANPNHNGSSVLNVTFLTAGTYTITQHYYNSCGTKTFVRNIQVGGVGGVSAGANQSVCLGNSVTLTASGGSNYTWSGGIQNGVPFTPTSTQTYTVTGTATGGCPNTSSATVIVNSVPSANAGNDFTITCLLNPSGSTIGMASIVGNTYSWTPTTGLSSATVSNPTANPTTTTTYTLTVTNPANGCTANDQVVVTVNNTPPTISTTPISSQSICVGGSASTLNVVVSGGTGTPTYQWYTVNGSTSAPIPGATNSSYTPPVFNTAGTNNYIVMVSQATNGCNTTSPNAEIIVISDPIVSTPLSGIYCQNGFANPLNVTVTGGINTSYSYQWYANSINNNTFGTVITGANTATFTPPTSMIGTYFCYCIVTNNPTSTGCSNTSPVAQITIVSSPVISSQPQANQSTCLGGILNTLNVTYIGGIGTHSFQWYSNSTNANTGGTLIAGATSSSYLPQSNSAGTLYYYCVISFSSMGSCQSITSNVSTVTVNSVPSANAGNDFTITCLLNPSGSTIGMASIVGNTYSWTPTTGLSSATVSNPTANPTTTTTYTLTATNPVNGCTATDTVVVTVNTTAPTVNAGTDFTKNCVIYTTGNTVGSPAVSGITYAWTPTTGLSSATVSNPTANPTSTTTYTLTATNPVNGCTATDAVVVTVNTTAPTINAGLDQNVCQGSNITLAATSNAANITWNNGAQNNVPFIGNTPGIVNYTATATGTNGCQASDVMVLTVLATPTVNGVSNMVYCNGEISPLISFTGSNTTSFSWTNSTPSIGLAASGVGNIASFITMNNTILPIQATIVVTPINTLSTTSCAGVPTTFTIIVNPTPIVNPIPNQSICAGETTTPIIVNGFGTSYNWINSNSSIGLPASGNGNISSFVGINNSSTSNVASISVTPLFTNAGLTCVGMQEDFTITVHPTPQIAPTPDQIVCCQSTVPTTVFVSNLPGVTVNWTTFVSSPLLTGHPSSGTGNIPSFTPINNSLTTEHINFYATPTSQFGCIGMPDTFTVSVLPCDIFVDPVSNIAVCNGSNINAITFTGNATSFSWVNTNFTTGIPTSGTASLPGTTLSNNTNQTVTSQIIVIPEYSYGSIGCTGNTMTFDISTYPTPQVEAGADQTICNGESTVLAGSGATSYTWSNGITDNISFSPTSTQTYVVQGTDDNGCVNIDSVTVIVNDPTTSTQTVTTCDSYTLNGQTYTSGGIYTQVIPNAAGCDSTITLDLTLNYSPSTPIVTIQNEVNLSTSNNTGVTYQWISCTDLTPIAGQTNSSFNPTTNGLFAVVVTNGCGSDTSECASVSTIGFNDLSNNEIKLYPNPNDGQFYLEIPEQLTNQQIEIFDLNGRLVFKQELNATLNLIQTEKLARGSYLLHFETKKPIYFIIN